MQDRKQVSAFVSLHCNGFAPSDDASDDDKQAFQNVKAVISRYLCKMLNIQTKEQAWETRLNSLFTAAAKQLKTNSYDEVKKAIVDAMEEENREQTTGAKLLELDLD